MWRQIRRTTDPRRQRDRNTTPAPLPRILLPYDRDADTERARASHRRRTTMKRTAGVVLVMLGGWLFWPRPVSDTASGTVAAPILAATVPVPVPVLPPLPVDTMLADTAFLSDSAIIAAAAIFDAAALAASSGADPSECSSTSPVDLDMPAGDRAACRTAVH
jgi:hypothetical protein